MEIVWSDLDASLFKVVLEYVKDFDLGPTEFSSSIIEVCHLILYPNIVYYLIDGDEAVIIAVLHALQSRETIRKIVANFIEKYK